jgi:hypothetical protein
MACHSSLVANELATHLRSREFTASYGRVALDGGYPITERLIDAEHREARLRHQGAHPSLDVGLWALFSECCRLTAPASRFPHIW